ncbi:hypothetical protein EVG20_g8442 [Dentipellis fragilis]|uniref:F-box domain-containing protein n=1 Tax=Dentipellis fragilis TaxID=205917 RepID=A0A4Y9Y708_9AGAM|nr:hypothetical protein EVG20_g8442 [Dentipellis fragilis]
MHRALNLDILCYMIIFLENRDIFRLSVTHRSAYEALLPLTWSTLVFTDCDLALRCCRSLAVNKDRMRFVRRLLVSYWCILPYPPTRPTSLVPFLSEFLRLAINLRSVDIRLLEQPGFCTPEIIEPLTCLHQLSTMALGLMTTTNCHYLSRLRTKCLRSIELEIDERLTNITDFLRPFQATLEEVRLNLWAPPTVHFASVSVHLVINNGDIWPHVHTLELKGISVLAPSTLVHAFPQVRSLRVYNQRRHSLRDRRPCIWPSLALVESNSLDALDELVDWEHTGHLDRLDLSAASVPWRKGRENMPWGSAIEIPRLEEVLRWTSPNAFSLALVVPMPPSFFDMLKIAAPQLGHLGIYFYEWQSPSFNKHFEDKELGDLLPFGMEELPITSFRLHLHVCDRLQRRIKNIVSERFLPKLPHVEYVHYKSHSDNEDTTWRIIRNAEGSVQLSDVPDDQQYALKQRGGFA